MPVVLVVAAPPAQGSPAEALATINGAVADGFGLRPSDVYATFLPAGTSVLGDASVPPWPVVLIHGSPRGPDPTARALDAVRTVVRTIWPCDDDHLWVQWIDA